MKIFEVNDKQNKSSWHLLFVWDYLFAEIVQMMIGNSEFLVRLWETGYVISS